MDKYDIKTKDYNKTIDARGGVKELVWDELDEFLDKHNFSNQDMLAVVCANLVNNLKFKWETEYKTDIILSGIKFDISIKPTTYKFFN